MRIHTIRFLPLLGAAMSAVTPSTPTPTTTTTSDLDAIIPLVQTLHVGGMDIPIRQIKLGSLPAVLRAVQPVAHLITERDKLDIPSIFMLYADECLTLISVLSGQPRAWVDQLETDEGITLFAALFEVNLDFFIQKVLPTVEGAVKQLAAKIQSTAILAG
jgi:hypothetical protein